MYEQLGYKAFGMPGKLAASCSITMQNIGGEAAPGAAEQLLLSFSLQGATSTLFCPRSHVQLPLHRQVRAAHRHSGLPGEQQRVSRPLLLC